MVQPRLGRARRVVASSSDDENSTAKGDQGTPREGSLSTLNNSRSNALENCGPGKESTLPTRSRAKPPPRTRSPQASTASPTSTRHSSPEKLSSKAAEKTVAKKKKSTTLHSFFNAATKKIQENAQAKDIRQEIVEDGSLDAIEDEFLLVCASRTLTTTQKDIRVVASRKRPLHPLNYQSSGKSTTITTAPSQKYRKISDGTRATLPETKPQDLPHEDIRPWAEKYAPTSLDDLVVHKKKAFEVQQWLTSALSGQPYRNVLVLKGPAGSGKTATLSVLSETLRFDIVEWKNPTTSDFLADDYVSASLQFEEFVNRGRHFNSLDFVGSDGSVHTSVKSTKDSGDPLPQIPHVLLVEDFPYAVHRPGTALQSFRSALLQSLVSRPMPGNKPPPIILIITESVLSNNISSAENFTAHRLLGPDILHHPATHTIEFNPVAPTFITKALNMVVQQHRRSTGVVLLPDAETIASISHIGDIRNAVATLEFLSARSGENQSHDVEQTNGRLRGRKSRNQSSSTSSTSAKLSVVGLRESTIGLFHAVGKVVYNKRSASDALTRTEPSAIIDMVALVQAQLPPHLTQHARSSSSEVSTSTLIDETGTDTSTFLSALHENFVPSCVTPSANSETTLDTLNACFDALSDADILLGPVFSSSLTRGGAAEGLRQDELAFEAGVRGLLHALPYPVKRQAYPGKHVGRSAATADTHRMYYPTDLKIWRMREEIVGLLDVLVIKALQGSLGTGVQWQRNNNGTSISQPGRTPGILAQRPFRTGVEGWRRNNSPISANPAVTDEEEVHTHVALGSGHSARQEMLLERLPYLSLISPKLTTATGSPFGLSLAQQIERITQFTGLSPLQDDEECTNPALDGRGGLAIGLLPSAGIPWVHKTGGSGDEEMEIRGLVLSDDDIEDD